MISTMTKDVLLFSEHFLPYIRKIFGCDCQLFNLQKLSLGVFCAIYKYLSTRLPCKHLWCIYWHVTNWCFLNYSDQDALRNAILASDQNSFAVNSPLEFTISLLYNETRNEISCDTEEKKWMNPCDITTLDIGSVY